MHSNRSDEPIYWLLFGAGGMAVGVVLPAIVILMIVAGFQDVGEASGMLNFHQVGAVLGNWLLSAVLFGVIMLTAWHACHRIYHTLHDLTIRVTKLHWFVFYGLAAAITFAAAALQFLIYCQLW
ncbi:MAG: fumarate reductase subunit D [Succinivibrionaceae bacterium]|nr:fumarate reductase subunit D [Succinivibrionaceae bacterium]